MARLRTRVQTVAAVSCVVGAWIACSPLVGQREDQILTPIAGSDAMIGLDSTLGGGSDAFSPPDIAMEGGGSDAFVPFDIAMEGGGSDAFVPTDIATEGGGSDAFVPPDIGAPFDAFPDAPPDAFVADAPPDAFVRLDAAPDAPPFDAAAPTDSSTRFDAAGSNGTSLEYNAISFYDCRCAGSGAPIGGWPILGAIFVIIVRRRSGSSSAR